MQWLLLTFALVTAAQCHILANGDSLEVHTVLGGSVTVKLEYPPVGSPIPNCCSNAKILQQPVLAGAVVTEVAHLRALGYLLRLDFVENIVTCHLVPDVGETNELSSTLCPRLTCPAGWNLLQDTCFLLTQVSGTWEEGQTFCQERGGALATISSNFQQVALSDMLTDDTWIGLKHRHGNHSYGWTDGSEHTYTSWAQEEPSIFETPDREECVEMRLRQHFLWNAAHCNQSKQYLCSVPGIAITASGPTTTTPTATTSTTIATTTELQECENSWSEYQSSCYKVFKTRLNYSEATASCTGLGAYLAIITSDGENRFVKTLLETYTYIGLNDLKEEGVFTWQDGSSLTFTNWRIHEPNNARGRQDCVNVSKDRDWDDNECDLPIHYICETSKQ